MREFFEPRSIALIGASQTAGKVGHTLWQRLRSWGGQVYPVNPKFGYKSIRDIPTTADLAVIAVPAAAVPAIVSDCVTKNVKAIVVISAGFAEAGPNGVRLEPPPVPLLGPNSLGLANPAVGLNLTFAQTPPPPGNIGLISQSGALASYLFAWAKTERLGFSKFVSLGNRLNLNENYFLEYLGRDSATKIIGLYLEAFADGKTWLKIASRVSRKKPVIVLVGGQTEAGKNASMSHTASLSPSKAVAAAALRQSGCLPAETISDFTNLLEVFSLAPRLTDNDLAIVTNAGGPAILATDTAASLRLNVGKPIDVLGDADAGRFLAGLNQALADQAKDAFLVIITPQAGTTVEVICRALARRVKHLKKPIIVSLLDGQLSGLARQILRRQQIPTIDLPQDACRALAALLNYYRRQGQPRFYPQRRSYSLSRRAKVSLPRGRLTWGQINRLTRSYDLPLVKTVCLTKPIKPLSFGWPLVLKADPAAAPHRTEARAVYLNLNSLAALRRAWRGLTRRYPTVLCQVQVSGGQELFVGLRRQPGWPPLLTVGGGGIYTDLYQDVNRVFLPVNGQTVRSTLLSTRSGQVIAGWRTGVNLTDQAVKLILTACRLFEEQTDLTELEINPALLTPEAAVIVDIKIKID
jgi:acetyltransferase